ncbi:MAG: rhodanese-related sulfurtransferase [Planctomycetota bacterium]|jgi:rhodanese-related sulfurtransferase
MIYIRLYLYFDLIGITSVPYIVATMSRIKEISVSELSSQMRNSDRFELIDIRTPAEIERGVLPNANILAMHMIPLKLDYFSESQNQIVIYCRTGSRSAQVCRFLKQQGIDNTISLRGGVVKWSGSGHALEPEPKAIIA